MRRCIYLLLVVVISCGFIQCKSSDSGNSSSVAEWTYLFYNDADFTPGYDPTAAFAASMYKEKNLNVLMLRDIHKDNTGQCNAMLGRGVDNTDAAIMSVDERNKISVLKELGEVDMGDPATLRDFIQYAKDNYPAKNYALAFYDHGGGFMGVCSDDTDKGWLTMPEMREALAAAGGVDMVLYTAPCLMGACESMYEIKEHTKVSIGSENLSGYILWTVALKDVRELLNSGSYTDIYDLSSKIVDAVKNNYGAKDSVTMSAVRSDKLDALTSSINKISNYYLDNQDKFNQFMDQNIQSIQTYHDYNMDIYDFAEKLLAFENNEDIKKELENLKSLIKEAVIKEIHGEKVPGSHGIAIYCPGKRDYSFTYSQVLLAKNTSWDTVVANYAKYKGLREVVSREEQRSALIKPVDNPADLK